MDLFDVGIPSLLQSNGIYFLRLLSTFGHSGLVLRIRFRSSGVSKCIVEVLSTMNRRNA